MNLIEVLYPHDFYAETKKGRYKKIKFKDPDDYVCDLRDVNEILRDDFLEYATLGEDLYICDENKKRVAVYRFIEGITHEEIFQQFVSYHSIRQYSPMELL